MLTVLESINLSTEFLNNKGIESPRINAELLLAKILNCKRLDLYLSFDRPLSESEKNQYREFIIRRSKFEPLQYIVGSVEFYGFEFKVNPSVLIPRPETEILVEKIIETHKEKSGLKILDIGTGSGIIAICLAKYLIDSNITGVDVSEEALTTAKENAVINSVENKIKFYQADILKDEIPEDEFDIIVSNPPYISNEEFPSLQPELRNYEPKEALTDESDGLSFYRAITKIGKKKLKKGGKIFFEVAQNQSEKVRIILDKEEFKNIKFQKDYLNIERVVSGEIEPEAHLPLEEI